MRTHAERFWIDFQALRTGITRVAVVTFVVAVISSYMAAFGFEQVRQGTLSTSPPREPLSFLRVMDPDESLVHEYTGTPVSEDPAIERLLSRMAKDERLFLVLPLDMVVDSVRSEASVPQAAVVIGIAPAFLPRVSEDSGALLWGDLGTDGSPIVDNLTLGGLPMRQIDSSPLQARFVSGDGRIRDTGDMPLVTLTPHAAQGLGLSGFLRLSEVAGGVTCYCSSSELSQTARLMNEAAASVGSDQVYYATGYDALIGPVQRSYALSEMLVTMQMIGTLLGVWCLAIVAARTMWRRRAGAYRVEIACGASERGLHVRQQALVALGFYLPVVLGYEVVDAFIRTADAPQPIPAEWRVGVYGALLLLHAIVTVPTALRIHRIYKSPWEVMRNV